MALYQKPVVSPVAGLPVGKLDPRDVERVRRGDEHREKRMSRRGRRSRRAGRKY